MASHIMRPASALAPENWQTYRILCNAGLLTQVCRAKPSVQRLPSHRRSYANPKKTKAPSKSPPMGLPRLKSFQMPPPAPPQLTLEFSSKDIPPMSVWESVMGLAPEDLTVADLDATARRYCASAIKGNSTWKGKLQQEQDLYTLHYTAILLLAGPMGPFWHLGAHMLRTASDLDYNPSTISLLRLVLRTTTLGPESVKYATALHGPLTKFRLLVHERNNPDVLTVDGVLRVRRGDARGALECFDHAIAIAKTAGDAFAPAPTQEELKHHATILPPPVRKPAWALESMCYLEKGRLCVQQGKIADAKVAFQVAAMELDMAAAYLELGKIMPAGSPERENYLLRAISTGKTDAIPLLSVFCKEEKSSDPASDPEEDQRWANEWRLLASKSGKKEGFVGAGA